MKSDEQHAVTWPHGFDHQTGNTLTLDDAEIYFEEHGPKTGRPLVLLHGGMGTIADFDGLLPDLIPTRRIIGMDSRGHGRSILGSLPLTYERLEADVHAIVSHLQLQDFDVLGFSDGGTVAYRLAAAGQNGLGKVVAIGAPWKLDAADPVLGILANVTPDSWDEKFPETKINYEKLNPSADFDALVWASARMWTDLSGTGYPGSTVDKIRVPMLLVRGADDHLVSEQQLKELATRVPTAEVREVDGAGHEVHKENPGELISLLHSFL